MSKMKVAGMCKSIVFTVFFIGCALPLSAQSSHEWSGFYVGGNAFASSDKMDAAASLSINQISNLFVTGRGIVIVPGTTRDFAASERKTNGGGGGQAGYQWQTGNFVFGAEGDFNPFHRTASVSQTLQIPLTVLSPVTNVTARRDARISEEFSLRGRAGVAIGKTLVYGTGGFSDARVRAASIDSFTNPGGLAASGVCGGGNTPCQFNSGAEGPVVTTASEKQNMNGWNLGGGIEQKFGRHFSIGFEYRHTDLRSKTFTLGSQTTVNAGSETRGDNGAAGLLGSVSTGPTRISLKSDSFGVKANFHF